MSSIQINNQNSDGRNHQNLNEDEPAGIGQKNVKLVGNGIQLAAKPPPMSFQEQDQRDSNIQNKIRVDGEIQTPSSRQLHHNLRNLQSNINDSRVNSESDRVQSQPHKQQKSKFANSDKNEDDMLGGQDFKGKKKNKGKQKDDKLLLSHEKPVSKQIKNIICLLDNKFTTIFMTLITVWALFGDDIRLLAAQKKHDDGFFGMMLACLIFFTLEVILASIAKKDYFVGFYFWLDIIATLSLIPDIGWFWDPIIGAQDVSASNSEQVTSIVSASRGARVGTKAGRVVRIIRLIRLIRIVKLYKHAQNAIEQGSDQQKVLPLPTMPAPSKSRVKSISEPPKYSQQGQSREMISKAKIQNSGNLNDSHQLNSSNKGRSDKKKKSLHESVQQRSVSGAASRQQGIKRSVGSGELLGNSYKSGRRAEIQPIFKQDGQKEAAALPEESKVGKKLSDLTTRRVIILVLIMMFSVPLFTLSTYTDVDSNTGFQFGLQLINTYAAGTNQRIIARQTYIQQYDEINTPLIYLRTGFDSDNYDQSPDPNDLRVDEKEFVTLQQSNQFVAIFDLRSTVKLNAGLGIARTIFICIVLAGGAIFFSKDANDLVIGPIQAMMQKVNKISQNPLIAAQEEQNQALLQEMTKNKQQVEKQKKSGKGKKKKKKEAPYQTQILEQTLIKIGALLALGFGEAGSKIIAENMKATGDVNPMIPGNKIIAIFGFCDIRQFTDATQILQQDVMLFVNQIAEIVHSIVDQFSGAANKNIGDAFLLVWKFRQQDMDYDQDTDNISLVQCHQVQQVADMSVLSFLKIIARINRSNKLSKYRQYPQLNRRMPNYRVRMGFGLHVGWAIQGAIGSDFKIDASYLSPNVNMASRLEAATKQFGTPLLISGQLHNLFSDVTKRYMRMIDRVTVKGSIQPLDLYTCDMDIKKLEVNPPDSQVLTKQERKRQKVRARIIRDRMRDAAFNNIAPVCALFQTDQDFLATVGTFPVDFYQTFNKGFKHYLDGNWGEAKAEFDKVNEIKGEADLPCENLLNIMEGHNFKAPNDWQGYRSLTQK